MHFREALDGLMPLGSTAGYYVVYRAHRDYRTDVPEYWFRIGYDGNTAGYGLQPFLSAHVSVADTSSIYEQLMGIHRGDPQEDVVSMTKKVKLKRWDVNEASCPPIKKQIADLQQLQFKPRPSRRTTSFSTL